MRFRLIFLASAALLMGACGSNDQDIEQSVDETAASPEYATGDSAGSGQVMDPEADTSRELNEDIVPSPDTQPEIDPQDSEIGEEPMTSEPATDDIEDETMPPDGAPQ
ncbi:hypothetical protein [Henriciella sp.]|uniref:hypothetical protein n=1 Tax=Henriciella sp. TaxID=1968823 RepID=UPI00260F6419|nr:hypothetical protein [Henriciella sp.]